MRKQFLTFNIAAIAISALLTFLVWKWFSVLLIIFVVSLIWGLYDINQKKHSLISNFPIFGRMRWLMEALRPKLYQYFIESDTDGKPINRIDRNTIYQRAKLVTDTMPFGTQQNVYAEGYEWMMHSITPLNFHDLDHDPRVVIGNKDCLQPYSSSIMNVSAMSYGSLSKNAIMALNAGAKMGNFAHNTGEGGLSPYHTMNGGDLIWQIGTGYFSSRNLDGTFSETAFEKNAALPQIKMIEIKLSQGAKPGHGGILPASKNTKEIASIRLVEPHTTIYSPPSHSAFDSPRGLIQFVDKLRKLSKGKPIGFKLCIGHKSEFIAICKAMIDLDVYPDFITVDGGEGGTGAAPQEFSNYVGAPLLDGLAFVSNTLIGFDIKKHIKIIASGKMITGFHIVRAMALGADGCNSARAMMMALGCIQALECNTNKCPAGVATQNPQLVAGLDVNDKKVRVMNYHNETVKSYVELMGAAGLESSDDISRSHIYRRIFMNQVTTFEEIFPSVKRGSFLKGEVPERYREDYRRAQTESWRALAKEVD